MGLFVLSDPHLSLGTDKPMDVFGRRWEGYTDKLREGWLQTVGAEDSVVLPGDISWAMTLAEALPDLRFLDSLPGTKYIGRGNHDYFWNTAAKMNRFFAENGLSTLRLFYNNAVYAEGRILCGTRGWFTEEKNAPKDADYRKIVAREAGRLEISIAQARYLAELHPGAETLAFFHFPPVFRDYVCTELVDVLKKYGIRRAYYGHIHSVYDEPPETEYDGITFSIVSADYLGFIPKAVVSGEKPSENNE